MSLALMSSADARLSAPDTPSSAVSSTTATCVGFAGEVPSSHKMSGDLPALRAAFERDVLRAGDHPTLDPLAVEMNWMGRAVDAALRLRDEVIYGHREFRFSERVLSRFFDEAPSLTSRYGMRLRDKNASADHDLVLSTVRSGMSIREGF
jgi:hypothetical protein